MQDENFEIRDLRNQDWLWTSKNLLFHKDIDEKMYKVYSGLAAFANNQTQQAFPSIMTLVQKLHMGRNTVIRALQALEKGLFISVKKNKGTHNIYSLLEISDTSDAVPAEKTLQNTPVEIKVKPVDKTKNFFKGIQDLRDKTASKEGENTRLFLLNLTTKYPQASKGVIWEEIKKFERYWTEKNSTGTKERWQKETTFEVDRRLVTWFNKKNEFKKVDVISKFQAGKAMAIKK